MEKCLIQGLEQEIHMSLEHLVVSEKKMALRKQNETHTVSGVCQRDGGTN